MRFFQNVKDQFRVYPREKGKIIVFFLIFALGGWAHQEVNAQGATEQESTVYGHAKQESDFHHHFSGSMEEALKLTDQQKEAFHGLKLDYDKMIVKKTADVRMAEVDLATLLGKDEPDRQAIQDQVKTIGKINEDMMMARIDSLLALRGMLTKPQYEQFRTILHQRMTEGMGHSPHEKM